MALPSQGLRARANAPTPPLRGSSSSPHPCTPPRGVVVTGLGLPLTGYRMREEGRAPRNSHGLGPPLPLSPLP